MAKTTTTIYGLTTDYGTEVILSAEIDREADVLDRLGLGLRTLPFAGVISGWVLSTAKTVGAGSGMVGGCYCLTTVAQAVTGLTNSVTNYVYAAVNSTSPNDGTVSFAAVTSTLSIPTNGVRLGTMVLNGAGTCTAATDNPAALLRDYMKPMRYRITPVTTETLTVAVGGETMWALDHSAQVTFSVPLNFYVTNVDPNVHVIQLCEGLTGGALNVLVRNDWTEAYGNLYGDYAYGYGDETEVQFTWQRDGWV